MVSDEKSEPSSFFIYYNSFCKSYHCYPYRNCMDAKRKLFLFGFCILKTVVQGSETILTATGWMQKGNFFCLFFAFSRQLHEEVKQPLPLLFNTQNHCCPIKRCGVNMYKLILPIFCSSDSDSCRLFGKAMLS